MSARTHFVYEAYDADGICLYIGCTGKPQDRYRAHMSGDSDARGWFDPFVTSWRVSGPYPKAVSLEIEKERIQRYQPIFNGVSHRNRERPGRRLLINDYLEYHGVRFVKHPTNVNRAVIVPIRGRRARHLRAVA